MPLIPRWLGHSKGDLPLASPRRQRAEAALHNKTYDCPEEAESMPAISTSAISSA